MSESRFIKIHDDAFGYEQDIAEGMFALNPSIVESIEYDYSKFDTAKMSEIGCAIRCRFFDDMVTEFVRNHKNPVIVNLGCGLDARCQRASIFLMASCLF